MDKMAVSLCLSIIFFNLALLILNVLSFRVSKTLKYTSTLFIIFCIGSLISIVINFNVYFANVLLKLAWSLIILSFIRDLIFDYDSLVIRIKPRIKIFLLTTLVSLIIIFTYYYYSINYIFLYNGHDPYLFGIPFEILEGDYDTRLRVFDNYPFEWSKYHFFNGSVVSVLLIFSLSKNIFIYKACKLILLFYMFLSANEFLNNVSIYKKGAVIFILTTVLSTEFAWLNYTNGAFSAYLFFISFYLWKEKKYDLLLISLLLFTGSTSRTIIPGLILISYVLFYNFQIICKKYNFIKLITVVILLLNSLCMIFVGKLPIIQTSLTNVSFNNYLNPGWLNLFMYRNIILNYREFYYSYPHFCSLIIAIIFLFLWVLFYKGLYRNVIAISFLLIQLFTSALSLKYFNDNTLLGTNVFFLFISPILFVVHYFERREQFFLLVFIFVSVFQIILMKAESSYPNLLLADFFPIFWILGNKRKFLINYIG